MASIINLSSIDTQVKCACAHHIHLDNKQPLKPMMPLPTGQRLEHVVLTNKRPLTSNFRIHRKVLGKGGFGMVRCCTNKRTKEMLAIKTVQLKGNPQAKSLQLEACRREAYLHEMCSGDPNVVRFVEKVESPSSVHMVMELCKGGDLRTFLNCFPCSSGVPVHLAAVIMRQVMSALCHIHSLGIVHRDIKACNILVSSPDNDITESSFKLADFGLAARFQSQRTGALIPCKGRVGTPGYKAPELLKGKAYYAPVDIWSSGIMLAKILTGEFPTFLQSSGKNTTQDQGEEWKIDDVIDFQSEPWSKLDSCLRNLLTEMLQFDPDKRPMANQLLDYCWIRNSGCCKHPTATNE